MFLLLIFIFIASDSVLFVLTYPTATSPEWRSFLSTFQSLRLWVGVGWLHTNTDRNRKRKLMYIASIVLVLQVED